MATTNGPTVANGSITARGVSEPESVTSQAAVSTLPKWPSGQVTGPCRSPPSNHRSIPGVAATSPRGSWRVNSAGSLGGMTTGPARTASPGRTRSSSGTPQPQQQHQSMVGTSTLQATYGAPPPSTGSWPPMAVPGQGGSGSMPIQMPGPSPRASFQMSGHQSPPQSLRSVEVLPGSVRGPPSSPPVPGPNSSPAVGPARPPNIIGTSSNILGTSSKGTGVVPPNQSPLMVPRSPVIPTRAMSPPGGTWGPAASGLIEAAASQRALSPRPPSPNPAPLRNTSPPATTQGLPQSPAILGSGRNILAPPSWQPPVMNMPKQPPLPPQTARGVQERVSVSSQGVGGLSNPGANLANTTVLVGPGDKVLGGGLLTGMPSTMQPPLPTGLGVIAIPKASSVQLQPEQDISSIHALSPLSRSELQIPDLADTDKKDILDHCRDTTKMVNQLAMVLKGLEADVDNLRRENQTLRKTVAQGLQFDAPPKASTASSALSQVVSAELTEQENQGPPPGAIPSAVSLTTPGPPRILGATGPTISIGSAGNEPAAVQQTPNRTTAPLMHASPRFGQTPQPNFSPLKTGTAGWPFPSTAPGPLTPSPGRRLLAHGARPSVDSPMGTLTSPPLTAESVATIIHEASPEFDMKSAVVHERGELQGKDRTFSQQSILGDGRRKVPPTVYEVQPGQAMDGLLWHMEQTIWLGSEGDEDRFKGKAQLLASDTIVSVSSAVEGLNRGTLKCPDDFCIAYSMSNNSYYLLFKRGFEEKAHGIARTILLGHSNAPVVASRPHVGVVEEEQAPTTRTATPDTMPIPIRQPQVTNAVSVPLVRECRAQSAQLVSVGLVAGQQPQYAPTASATDFTAVPTLRSEVAFSNKNAVVDAELSFNELPSVSTGKADELAERLADQLRRGIQPSEEAFDSVITAVGGDGAGTEGLAKAEEWFWKAIEMGTVPGEASFNTVLLAACREGDIEKAEAVMLQMLHFRLRGSKEIFDVIIRMFSERRDAMKVEEWLLNAGQSGWTPGQEAFEAVVQLFAQIDAAKAEEWLSRAQQTEYRLPDVCFDVVIRAFLRVGNASKANEWLSRLLNDGRVPSESTLQEAVTLLIESGDVPHAEAWLAQLASRYNVPVDAFCLALFGAAMHAGDLDCAERQLEALGDTDPGRTQLLVMAHSGRGDAVRAKLVLERYRKLGGLPNPEINLAMLSTCAAAEDREGAQALARMLAHGGHLTMAEFPTLQRAMGEEQATALMKELGLSGADSMQSDMATTPATSHTTPSTRERHGSSGGRSPSAKASTKNPVRRGGGRGSRTMR